MIFLKGLAGAGVALEERAVKPLYGRVQATPQTRLFADKANRADVVPGKVAAGNAVFVAGEGEFPEGLFGSYGEMGYVEDGIDATVWVLGPDAAMSVKFSAVDKGAGWEAAKALLAEGKAVFVGANSEGKLTLGADVPAFRLLDVDNRGIIVGGLPGNASLAATSGVAANQTISITKTDLTGTMFAGKDLGTIQEDVKAAAAGMTVVVTGTLTCTEWPEFGDPADVPHHYIALTYTGGKGTAFIRRYPYATGTVHVFKGEESDPVGTPTNKPVISFLPDDADELVYDVYANADDAASNVNPVRFTIDVSRVVRA